MEASHPLQPNPGSFPWNTNTDLKNIESTRVNQQEMQVDNNITQTYPWEQTPAKANASILNTDYQSFDDQDTAVPLRHVVQRQKNWPKCYPIVCHDIEHDVPLVGRPHVQKSYLIWKLLILLYLLNLATIISFMASGAPKYKGVGGLFLAIGYLVIIPIVTFFTWHMPLYQAVRSNSTSLFFLFFATFFIQICQCIFLAVGISSGGGGGLIGGIDMFSNGYTVQGVLSIICVAFSVLLIYLSCKHIYTVGVLYRHGGHSLDTAKKEALGHAMQNKTIQKSAVRAVMNSV